MTLTKINSKGIKDGEILNADINASAAIASTKLAKPINLADNEKVRFGTGTDLEIYHDGSTNIIDAATSNAISFRRGNSEQFFIGAAEFKGGDNKIIKLGTGDDLQIYHDGSNSRIHSANHSLIVRTGNQFGVFNGDGSETILKGTINSSVELYHDNVKKLETTSSGVTVSGNTNLSGTGTNALQINGTGVHELYSYHDSGGVGWATGTGGSYGELLYLDESNSAIKLYTSGTKRFTVDSSGKVGIGAINPATLLQIESTDPTFRIKRSDGSAYGEVTTDTSGLISFKSDPSNAANGSGFIFTVDNSEKARIDSDGNLGIGTTTPDGKLHLVTGGTTDEAHVTLHASATSGTNNSGEVLKVISSRGTGNTNAIFNVLTNTNTQVFSAHGNGNVGIGTPNPDKTLEIRQTNAGHDIVAINRAGSNTAAMYLGNDSSNNGVIASNNSDLIFGRDLSDTFTERMRLTNAGSLYVNNSGTLNIGDSGVILAGGNGIHKVARDCSTGAAVFWVLGGSGQAYVLGDGDLINSNGNYDGLSDQRLKENIVDANSQWDDIKAVKVRNYNFKESTKYSTHKQIGVIAQELEASGMNGLVKDIEDILYIEGDELPEGKNIGDVKEEGCKAVSYSVLYMKALKALQEAMTKIETLETKVAALEAA